MIRDPDLFVRNIARENIFSWIWIMPFNMPEPTTLRWECCILAKRVENLTRINTQHNDTFQNAVDPLRTRTMTYYVRHADKHLRPKEVFPSMKDSSTLRKETESAKRLQWINLIAGRTKGTARYGLKWRWLLWSALKWLCGGTREWESWWWRTSRARRRNKQETNVESRPT